MSKQTYHFAQYRTDHIARCIAERKSFTTYGNLSGNTNGFPGLWGWECDHPAWEARLREIALAPDVWQVEYVVYSYRTVVAVLVRDISARKFGQGDPEPLHWEVDYAASWHSTCTSRAVHSFLAAIDVEFSWHARQLGTISNIGQNHEHVHRVYRIGHEWAVAERLSDYQRRLLSGQEIGRPMRGPTRQALQRVGVLDESGWLTQFGLQVAAYCVGAR